MEFRFFYFFIFLFFHINNKGCSQNEFIYEDQSGFLVLEFHPLFNVNGNVGSQSGSALAIRYGYTTKRGFIGSLDFVRTIYTKNPFQRYWEFSLFNFGKNYNHGQRIQFPVTFSAGFFGYKNKAEIAFRGYKFGFHPSVKIYVLNKTSIRFSSNLTFFIGGQNIDGSTQKKKRLGWVNFHGFGVTYDFYK